MSGQEQRPQLNRADVERLGREDPAELAAAYRAGQLDDVLAGADTCPTCRRPMSER
jgi:hypothetical protein